jgi:hypothetical protein
MIYRYLSIKKTKNKNTIYAVYREKNNRKDIYISKKKPFCIISHDTTKQLKKLFNKSELLYEDKKTIFINIENNISLNYSSFSDNNNFIIDNIDKLKSKDIRYLLYLINELKTIYVLGLTKREIQYQRDLGNIPSIRNLEIKLKII